MLVRVPLSASGPPVEAELAARPNQLVVEARLGQRMVRAHLDERGRWFDLLTPGARLVLAPREEIGHKTSYQVVGVYHQGELIPLDSQLAHRLVAAALTAGALPQFARYTKVQREAMIGEHRFDFRLSEGLNTCIVEVKSVSKVEDGLARFPDTPTERGRQQMLILAQMARNGQRCAIVFIIQRQAARALVPNDDDPECGKALRAALAAGVEAYAYLCPPTLEGLTLGNPVPVYGSIDTLPVLQIPWIP